MVDRTISTISVYSQTNFRFLMQPLWFSSLIFCTASLMLMLVALFTPYWVTESTPHGLLHGGLWSICLDPNCDFYPVNLAWFVHTARTFLVLGTICGFLAWCCVSFSFLRTQVSSVSLVLLASIFSITAGTLFLLGMCIFTYIYRNSRPYTQHLIIFGSSYSLAWACIPMFIITGALLMKTHRILFQ
ncbi:transmembrane protein 235-like [Pantherophis guttatus]|uniref:Transmembrane protein 235-like n=1 Tax=Pantherophis guttatus TaxID=94885 RepID=A0A6P9CK16_PANGU|nr:transmembrane protein 235-like [Pantherophis guttatus]